MESQGRVMVQKFCALFRSFRSSSQASGACRCHSTSKTSKRMLTTGNTTSWQTPQKETGYLLLVCPLTAFGLGCWQVKRRNWKLGLIRELEERTMTEPVPLPEDMDSLKDLEYRKVKLSGEFDHSRELYVLPRPSQGDRKLSGLKGQDNGMHVITPFYIKDRNMVVLVNRGWVPREHKDPSTRIQGQISGEIDLVGVVRKTDTRQPFAPHNIPEKNQWYHRDVAAMSEYLGTEPYFFDADAGSTVMGGPLGGQTRVTLRNEHMSYIFTWFSLAAITGYMWFQRYGPVVRRVVR